MVSGYYCVIYKGLLFQAYFNQLRGCYTVNNEPTSDVIPVYFMGY